MHDKTSGRTQQAASLATTCISSNTVIQGTRLTHPLLLGGWLLLILRVDVAAVRSRRGRCLADLDDPGRLRRMVHRRRTDGLLHRGRLGGTAIVDSMLAVVLAVVLALVLVRGDVLAIVVSSLSCGRPRLETWP